ncbi:MAG TPA: TOMM precursor leader peptide-binding protein [Marmoricola sp.]|nr:TOMM precursor leader peptide-binding protein [Marmoricola sp.]
MTRRPVLAPGLAIVQRAPGELQIGLTAAHRLRIADSPAVRRTLALLDRGEAAGGDAPTRRVLARLAPVLRDGDALAHPQIPAAEVAAVMLRFPHSAAARLQARQAARVQVLGDLVVDPRPLFDLCGLGVYVAQRRAVPSVVLLLVRGEADRAEADALVRSGTPHLLVRAVESEILLGPFVVPGVTACLRCTDLHRGDEDQTDPAAFASRSTRHDGVPDPVDAALAAMAIAWAVRDLVRFTEGDRPDCWSAVLTLTDAMDSLQPVRWPRHPRCGCSWADPVQQVAESEDASATMGA